MSKLIDADALGVALHAAWVEEHSSHLREAVWRVRRRIDTLPDASEPLRKRIAELEVAVRDLIETIDYNRTPNEFFDTRLPEIEALLKGAQDA